MSNQLPITTIVTVSVAQTSAGLNQYNTSNLAIISDETPQSAEVNLLFGGVSASGQFILTFPGQTPLTVAWNETAASLQTAIQALGGIYAHVNVTGAIATQSLALVLSGQYGPIPTPVVSGNTLADATPSPVSVFVQQLGGGFSGNTAVTYPYAFYANAQQVASDFGTSSRTYAAAVEVFSQNPTILNGSGQLIVILQNSATIATVLSTAIGYVNFFGVLVLHPVSSYSSADVLAASAFVQSQNMMMFWASYQNADLLSPSGILYEIQQATYTQSRGIYYGDSSTVDGVVGFNAVLFAAGYAGRALSTNFNGSNTVQTMQLKQISGVLPDPTMTQTIYNEAQTAGADVYASIQGLPGILQSGANTFFDSVYNLRWFAGAVQIAIFNYLAQSATKVPQTEDGMNGLKSAVSLICQQAVANGYVAPGTWTSPNTFGPTNLFYANISQYGFYIYSTPISQQLPTARAARQAPLIQIALKEAGAINTSNVLIYVNP